MRKLYLHTVGSVGVLAAGLYTLSASIDGDYPTAWGSLVGGAFIALCWRWGLKHNAEAEKIVPAENAEQQLRKLQEVDPVSRDLHRKLARAIERKQARNHIRQAIRERNRELLAGKAVA